MNFGIEFLRNNALFLPSPTTSIFSLMIQPLKVYWSNTLRGSETHKQVFLLENIKTDETELISILLVWELTELFTRYEKLFPDCCKKLVDF